MSRSDRRAPADGIEFLAPRVDLFATGGLHDVTPDDELAPPELDDDGPRSRWLTAVGGLALVALVATGVVAAAPWDGDTAAAPTSTAPAPPATDPTVSDPPASRPDPSTTETPSDRIVWTVNRGFGDLPPSAPAAVLAGHLVDPAQLASMTSFASSMPLPLADPAIAPGDDWMTLWAERHATRQSGTWIAVGWSPAGSHVIGHGEARVALDGGRIALFGRDAGVRTLQLPIGVHAATITWNGIPDDDVVAAAAGLAIDGTGLRWGDDFGRLIAELDTVVTGASAGTDPVSDFLFRGYVSTAWYQRADGREITVWTSVHDERAAALRRFVVGSIPGDALSGANVVRRLDERIVGVGRIPGMDGAGGTNMLDWHEDGVAVRITGDVPAGELMGLVPHVRAGTAGEWWALGGHADGAATPVRHDAGLIGFGDLADGTEWSAFHVGSGTIQFSVFPHPGSGDVTVISVDLADGPCGASADLGSTTVVCVRANDGEPWGASAGAPDEPPAAAPNAPEVVRVTGAWGERRVDMAAMPTVGARSSFTIGIVRFEEPGAFSVEIVTPDGRAIPVVAAGPTDAAT